MSERLTRFTEKVLHFPSLVFRALVDRAIHALTDPRKIYGASEVSDISALKRRVQACDVLLVAGNARISYVVKVLTLSPWSHVVLYVGDRRDLLSEAEIEEYTRRYGSASLKHLVIDADPVRRVHLKPLDDYAGMMIRLCRAEALSKQDSKAVIENALSQLGRQYDVRHIVSLLFFFAFPWELFPASIRRFITDFTLSEDDRICSRVLAEAFHSVGYPIRPLRVVQERSALHNKALGFAVSARSRSKTAMKLLLGGRFGSAMGRLADRRYGEIHLKGARHITPADYDLSRFFAIIKDEQDLSIPYREAATICPIPEP